MKKQPVKKRAANKRVIKTEAMDAEDLKWRAEDDVRTLMRAEEIKKDKTRLARAKQVAKKQAAEAQKVATFK